MASLIEGYEYDIFISYRQKDNKYDGWVTEFVTYLKNELEATFKEDISVYFDINPNNGLLETHDVDASLKEKLKCLVFMPIISHTYCDPKSYAWEHEFKAFMDLASQDKNGLKVKLQNGNVASRLIPVQIHDLYPEDKTVIEKEIGGVLRAIEFIYKEAGVNRPLTNMDDEKLNLNKTRYRNQINKAANSIEEVIHALRSMQYASADEKLKFKKTVQRDDFKSDPNNLLKSGSLNIRFRKLLIFLASAILLIAFAFAIFKVIKLTKNSEYTSKPEKSIAVLPFLNDSQDQENTYFINGLMEEVLNNLQKIKDFRVLSQTSTEQYRGTAVHTIPEIAKKLDVNYIVEGSGQKYGNKFRLRVQLIEAKNERHLWGESFEKEIKSTNDIFTVQSEIAQSIAAELKATITPEERQLIEKPPTANLTAYDFYQRGREEYLKYGMDKFDFEAVRRAEPLFHQALSYDSTFALAYAGLADVFWKRYDLESMNSNQDILDSYLDSMLILTDLALKYDNQLAEAYHVRGGYYTMRGNAKQALEEWDKAIKCNPNQWFAYWDKGWFYGFHLFDMLKSLQNFQKAASLNHGTGLNEILDRIGTIYYMAGFPEKGDELLKEILKLDGDSLKYLMNIVYNNAETRAEYQKAIEFFTERYRADTTNAYFLNSLGYYNLFTGRNEESLYYYKKYLEGSNRNGQIYPEASIYIGYAFWQNGYRKEAEYYFKKIFEISVKNTKPEPWIILTRCYNLAGFYAFKGEKKKALDNLREFTKIQFCPLGRINCIKNDPLFETIRNDQEFKSIVNELESKYQAEHERVKKWLDEQSKL
jgi:TolB-like protein